MNDRLNNPEWAALRRQSSQRFLARDFDGALAAELQALALAEQAGATGSVLTNSLHAIATLHRMKGQNAQAVPFLERALARCQTPGNERRAIEYDLAETLKETGVGTA